MIVNNNGLSALSYDPADLCLQSLELTQFARSYNGGFSFNFVDALSGIQDFKQKTNTNFYLTPPIAINDVVYENSFRLKAKSIYTTLNFSKLANNYLTFKKPEILYFNNVNLGNDLRFYGATTFTTVPDIKNYFTIDFVDEFFCRVWYKLNGVKYFLVVSDDDEGNNKRRTLFASENRLSSNGSLLEYVITTGIDQQYILFLSTKGTTKYFLTGDGQRLVAEKFTNQSRLNSIFIFDKSARLSVNAIINSVKPYNTSFIEYNDTFKINDLNSNFDIKSNYLFSKVNIPYSNVYNLLTLKNISDNFDSFTSSNTLLSGVIQETFSSNIREYTSILNDIATETDTSLILNYVSYNTYYEISPGTTIFKAPSSLNPFTRLNINDTKFIKCGAFAYYYPYYADKVYRLDDFTPVVEGQYLCTWLSGAPDNEGVWVDRYYYPDNISKEQALLNISSNITYTDPVEQLIRSNINLQSSVRTKLFFDKKSDLTFEPDKTYKYERVQPREIARESILTYCDTIAIGDVYFKRINQNGGFAIKFNYTTSDFNIRSARNEIDGGIHIIKTGDVMEFNLNLLDNATQPITVNKLSKTISLAGLESGNIFFNYNARRGVGNVYINGNKVYSFSTPPYKYVDQPILFGDLYLEVDDQYVDMLTYYHNHDNIINELIITDKPLTEEEEINTIIVDQIVLIDTILISLPSGMINYSDEISIINVLDSNLKSKSNYIDINIKNLNIDNEDILTEVKNNIIAQAHNDLPVNIKINNVNFVNYKS